MPRGGRFSHFCKSQPLEEPCALWCTKLHKLCRSISWWWRNSKAPACCMWCKTTFLAHLPCKRKIPRQQKKRKLNMCRDSSFCAKSVRNNIFTNGAPYFRLGLNYFIPLKKINLLHINYCTNNIYSLFQHLHS